MHTANDLINALKRAIRAQDKQATLDLAQELRYADISPQDINSLIEDYSIFFQDKDFLTPFVELPFFDQVSSNALGHILLTAIRLDAQDVMRRLLYHPGFKRMSQQMTQQVISAALQFQNREYIDKLYALPFLKGILEQHLEETIQCAVRTDDREWVLELVRHTQYKAIADSIFPYLLKWGLLRKDKKLLHLIINRQHFNEKTEQVLKQEIVNNHIEQEESKTDQLEKFIMGLLIKHLEFKEFSSLILSWIIEKAISFNNATFFHLLIIHPNYNKISNDTLADLIVMAILHHDKEIFKLLMHHPNATSITGEKLGLIIEAAVKVNAQNAIHFVTKHSQFEKIPDDIFKRIAITELARPNDKMKQNVLSNPLLKPKYGSIIFELIRRNETDLIHKFFREPLLKNEAIEQLIKYTKAEEYFINSYIVRDILREAILTGDAALIATLFDHLIFKAAIEELMQRAIQFDDDALIERFLLDPKLTPFFKSIVKRAPPEDKKRLFYLFTNNPNFVKKPAMLANEIRSWKEF